MPKTLVKTDKRGWYIDAAEPEGKKVRKQDGDQIFDNILEAQSAQAVLDKVHGTRSGNGGAPDKDKRAKEKTDYGLTSTGKPLHGPGLTIKCEWKEKGRRCNKERVINAQDRFQVKFCLEHQEQHRRELRNAKARERTAKRQKGRAKAKA